MSKAKARVLVATARSTQGDVPFRFFVTPSTQYLWQLAV
jgi:hypothetical protein